MRLCMFHPVEHPLKRGWVGRIEGDHVIQLAAQTLQAFFTGGGAAREHAVYPLNGVRMLAPVLNPPSVRVFDDESTFEFANPAAIVGPGASIGESQSASNSQLLTSLTLLPRVAAMIGAEGAFAGFSVFAEWRDPRLQPPKDRDFALGLGPHVITADELDPEGLDAIVRVAGEERVSARFVGFDWTSARDLAAAGTVMRPGDLLAGPAAAPVVDIGPGTTIELEVEGIGVLDQAVLGD